MKNFPEEFASRTAFAEQTVRSYLPAVDGYLKGLFDASDYSVLVGGKRLRPLIMKAAFDACGGKDDSVLPFMAALEMIHSSSLVHDDLPCMDNDELRRGNLTTWKKFGEDTAVLVGDDLLVFAFETAAKAFSLSDNPGRIGEAISVLAHKAGRYGMIGGQSVDVASTGEALKEDKLDFIYRLKTSALVEAAMMIGTILAGGDKEAVSHAEKAGSAFGMAFQIRDDILDVISSAEELGKPIHSDEKNDKTTTVTLWGMEKAKQKVEEYSLLAMQELEQLPGDTTFLKELFAAMINRKK